MIGTAGCYVLPVGRPRYHKYRFGVFMVDISVVPGRGIPDLHRFIGAARGDAFAVGRPGNGGDDIREAGMTVISIELFSCQGVPHLYRSIGTG